VSARCACCDALPRSGSGSWGVGRRLGRAACATCGRLPCLCHAKGGACLPAVQGSCRPLAYSTAWSRTRGTPSGQGPTPTACCTAGAWTSWQPLPRRRRPQARLLPWLQEALHWFTRPLPPHPAQRSAWPCCSRSPLPQLHPGAAGNVPGAPPVSGGLLGCLACSPRHEAACSAMRPDDCLQVPQPGDCVRNRRAGA
jgi:hypothetical protein